MWHSCLIFMLIFTLAFSTKEFSDSEVLNSINIISKVNTANSTWKADQNPLLSLKSNLIDKLVSTQRKADDYKVHPNSLRDSPMIELPSQFDAREHWQNCASVRLIQDQGPCPASWAVASASALTDRFCIAMEGFFQKPLSAEYILSCNSDGSCDGTYSISSVWYDFTTLGLVTGGGFSSGKGCQPYSLPSCSHHVKGRKKNCYFYKNITTPQCKETCSNFHYAVPFAKDFYRAKSYIQIHNDVNQTQLDIYLSGPLVTCFTIYEDFLAYKTGVYQHVYGRELGTTCAKIVGWGVESETPYWLAANTWNSEWGEEGFFKIRRGNNECDFESWVYGGIPDVLR